MYRIYPEYLMLELSRSEGRRISRKKALKNLKAGELRLACERLGCDFEFDETKAYSRQWWNKRGVFMVDKQELLEKRQIANKQQLLHVLSSEITEFVRPALEKLAKEQAVKQKRVKKTIPSRDLSKRRPTGARRRRR
jgi:signal recognition particle subunit SEC65